MKRPFLELIKRTKVKLRSWFEVVWNQSEKAEWKSRTQHRNIEPREQQHENERALSKNVAFISRFSSRADFLHINYIGDASVSNSVDLRQTSVELVH